MIEIDDFQKNIFLPPFNHATINHADQILFSPSKRSNIARLIEKPFYDDLIANQVAFKSLSHSLPKAVNKQLLVSLMQSFGSLIIFRAKVVFKSECEHVLKRAPVHSLLCLKRRRRGLGRDFVAINGMRCFGFQIPLWGGGEDSKIN